MLGRSSFQVLRPQYNVSYHKAVLIHSPSVIRAHIHVSSSVSSISPLRMPALSPTMESGQISRWNVKTGDRFSTGDVLLTVETDKAEVDVEAQDDGYMGPQLFGPGSSSSTKTIQVGEVIAVIGDESEDIQGNIDIPTEWSSQGSSSSSAGAQDPPTAKENESHPTSTAPNDQPQGSGTINKNQAPKTSAPISPAVHRILHELGVKDATKIKGTGLRGRLTKGDVLTHFKKASSPTGTAQKMIQADADARLAERSKLGSTAAAKSNEEEALPMDAIALRRFITEGLSHLTQVSSTSSIVSSFDLVLEDYSSSSAASMPKPSSRIPLPSSKDRYFEGLESS